MVFIDLWKIRNFLKHDPWFFRYCQLWGWLYAEYFWHFSSKSHGRLNLIDSLTFWLLDFFCLSPKSTLRKGTPIVEYPCDFLFKWYMWHFFTKKCWLSLCLIKSYYFYSRSFEPLNNQNLTFAFLKKIKKNTFKIWFVIVHLFNLTNHIILFGSLTYKLKNLRIISFSDPIYLELLQGFSTLRFVASAKQKLKAHYILRKN